MVVVRYTLDYCVIKCFMATLISHFMESLKLILVIWQNLGALKGYQPLLSQVLNVS